MFSILDRTTISESWQLMVIGITLIAGVFFATDEFRKVISMICDLGIDTNTAVLITFLQLPNTVVFCLPAGVLLSTGLVLWRRTFDYEILALSVAGASTARILRPFVFVSVGAALLSYGLSDSLVPESRRTANKLLISGALNSNLPRSQACLTFFQYNDKASSEPLKHVLLAGNSSEKKLFNVVIFDHPQSKAPKIIWAKTGLWHHGQWQLENGFIYEITANESRRMSSHFEKLNVDAIARATQKFKNRGPLSTEQTTSELKAKIEEFRSKGLAVPNMVMLRYLRRLSQPAACLLLAFAALPLCVARPRKRTYLPLAYIGIVVALYFVVQQICLSLGDNDRLSPMLAAWLPAGMPMVIGLIAYAITKARR
jgi:lipopolysaccharide export system permease protein